MDGWRIRKYNKLVVYQIVFNIITTAFNISRYTKQVWRLRYIIRYQFNVISRHYPSADSGNSHLCHVREILMVVEIMLNTTEYSHIATSVVLELKLEYYNIMVYDFIQIKLFIRYTSPRISSCTINLTINMLIRWFHQYAFYDYTMLWFTKITYTIYNIYVKMKYV